MSPGVVMCRDKRVQKIHASMVNVFLIDDHPAVIAGIGFLLSEPENRARLVGASYSVPDALPMISLLDVNVILLDLFIRDEQPATNLILLRASWPKMPIVIYSAEDSTWWKRRMFESGINAYLNKGVDNETIIATVLKVSDGSILLTPDVKNLFTQASSSGETISLTYDELAVGKEISFGLSIKEIARKMGRSTSSIEKTLRSTRQKTGALSNADLTRVLISLKLVPLSR
jgi:DNA-binding NarL/FixJ family response regulator